MRNFLQILEEDGGFTLNAIGESPESGYVVAVSKELERVVRYHQDTLDRQISKYSREFRPEWLGAWVEGDQLYLDTVEVVETREEAERLGRERQQISIYDVAAQEVIYL